MSGWINHLLSYRTPDFEVSGLVAGFSTWIRKRATSAQGKTTPEFEVSSEKRPKRSNPDEELRRA